MGGNVAGLYAASYPSHLCSVTLMCPAGKTGKHLVFCHIFSYLDLNILIAVLIFSVLQVWFITKTQILWGVWGRWRRLGRKMQSRWSPPIFHSWRICWDYVVTTPSTSPGRYRTELHGLLLMHWSGGQGSTEINVTLATAAVLGDISVVRSCRVSWTTGFLTMVSTKKVSPGLQSSNLTVTRNPFIIPSCNIRLLQPLGRSTLWLDIIRLWYGRYYNEWMRSR